MAKLNNDIKKEFDAAYNEAYRYWMQWLQEAQRDMDFFIGRHWTDADKLYLSNQKRNALVFNKIYKVVKLFEGLERKGRTSLKCVPVENSDSETSDQLTSLVLYIMQYANGYNILSDAFSKGAVVTGANLVQIILDYSDDMVNGDIKLARMPFNRFLLAPGFSNRDLSDCQYILKRDYISKNEIMMLLPDKANEIKRMTPKGFDSKFQFHETPKDVEGKYMMTWDEMYLRTARSTQILIDKKSGNVVEDIQDKRKQDPALDLYIKTHQDDFEIIKRYKPTVELRILVDDIPMYTGPDRLEIDDFPFVPVMGLWDPEHRYPEEKLRGAVRLIRDPQTEVNKRRSKLLDMIDSQLASGWEAEEQAIVNPKALMQTGQGQVIWYKKDQFGKAKKIDPPQIPEAMFAAVQLMDDDVMNIVGANKELFGLSETHDTVGMAVKMRQESAMTIIQDYFDNYEASKKLLGMKLIKAIQNNWSPNKIQRILNVQPTPEFFTKNFSKYDCVTEIGLLTSTQQQMFYAELKELKAMGVDIPINLIIESSPMQNKKELVDALKAQSEAQAKAQEAQAKTEQLTQGMMEAQILSSQASATRQTTQAKENSANQTLDIVKSLKQLQDMDLDKIQKNITTLTQIQQSNISNGTNLTRR